MSIVNTYHWESSGEQTGSGARMKAWSWHTVMMVWIYCAAAGYGTVAEEEGRAPAEEPMAHSRAHADAPHQETKRGENHIAVSTYPKD